MPKIRLLDRQVSELIAAGEVVERPASVIKELVENAIDAGAEHITVEIRDGGITYMRITDDGCGIAREDVPVAFLRHATSKVWTKEDLNGIVTLGFRGEALASVAAVAEVEMITCREGQIEGTRYVIRGGEEQLCEDAGCPVGTTITVRDLFYNIPARMKFLKKDVSEGNAVAGVVERLALSHAGIAFRFIRNGKIELQTAGDSQLSGCILAVFGKSFVNGLIPVDYSMGGIRVSGYICKPDACRPNRTMQHFYINGRYVKTQTGAVALERAYKGVMMVGKFPACILLMEMPPETVDANVHPAKIEVRFINEKPVFETVYYAVKSALETGDTFHRVLLKEENPAPPDPAPMAKPISHREAPSPAYRRMPPVPQATAGNFRYYPTVSVDDDRPSCAVLQDGTPSVVPSGKTPVLSSAEKKEDILPAEEKGSCSVPFQPEQMTVQEEKLPIRVLGEVFRTYIVAEMGNSFFLIDKHAAHERILYNELKASERSDAQLLLSPIPVSVSREEHIALTENAAVLQQAGIEIEDFGGATVLVRTFPLRLSGEDIDSTIREIASGLAEGSQEIQTAKLDWIYHSSACRAATKAGDDGKPEALRKLAERVLTTDEIRYCPHGRPVCVEITKKELEKKFGRTR